MIKIAREARIPPAHYDNIEQKYSDANLQLLFQ